MTTDDDPLPHLQPKATLITDLSMDQTLSSSATPHGRRATHAQTTKKSSKQPRKSLSACGYACLVCLEADELSSLKALNSKDAACKKSAESAICQSGATTQACHEQIMQAKKWVQKICCPAVISRPEQWKNDRDAVSGVTKKMLAAHARKQPRTLISSVPIPSVSEANAQGRTILRLGTQSSPLMHDCSQNLLDVNVKSNRYDESLEFVRAFTARHIILSN
jgi:hypothetical protein